MISGDTIFVEDVILYKSLLLQHDSTTTPRQATANRWPRLFAQNITVYFPPVDNFSFGFTQSEVEIMKEGFNMFLRSRLNNGGGINSFYFHRNPQIGAHVKVNLRVFNNSSNVCGNAELATSFTRGNERGVQTGSNMNINLNYLRGRNGKFKLSRQQLIFLVAHEFGHMIGLRHTDWKNRREAETYGWVGAYPIPGTVTMIGEPESNPDPNSVFNAATCGITFADFSAFDKIAIKYMTDDAQTRIY